MGLTRDDGRPLLDAMTGPADHREHATQRVIWRDRAFVPWPDATVHVLAQSLQRGSLAFDYFSVHATPRGTALFRVRDHMERLRRTCRIVGLPLAYETDELVDACLATVRRNPGAKAVKVSALIPSVEADLVPQDARVSVFIAAFDSATDVTAAPERPATLSLKVEREKSARSEDILPVHAKVAANYTAAMTAKWRARREGYDDIVLLDEHGFVTEAPTANVFVVDDAGLATPPARKVLLGITRASVVELAAAAGVRCAERDVDAHGLRRAREVFLTSSSVGVWPVLRVDGQAIGDGRIGPVTARLRRRYAAATRGENPAFAHWLHYL